VPPGFPRKKSLSRYLATILRMLTRRNTKDTGVEIT
jgi:hypothetical protein